MAPERHQGDDSGVAGDVYAVGCLLWRVLTGVTPYAGSEVEVAVAHLQAPLPQLPGTDAFADAVNGLLRRAMAKAPADRYATARDMAADCRAAAAVAPAAVTLPEHTQIRQAVPLAGSTPGPVASAARTATRLRPARRPSGPPAPPGAPAAAETPLAGARRGRRPALVAVATVSVLALVGGGFAAAQAGRDTSPAASPRAATPSPAGATEAAAPSGTGAPVTVVPGTELARTAEPRRRALPLGVRLPETGDFLSGATDDDTATGSLPGTLAPVAPTGPRQGRGGRTGRGDDTRSGSGGRGGPGGRGGSAEPQPAPEPTPAPEPEPTYRCWNGAETMGPDDCSLPTGTAGLAWVFPGLRGCRAEKPLPDRVTTVVCAYDTADGPGELRLVEWSSFSAANQSYRQKYGKTARPWRSSWGYTWVARTQRTNLYGDGPFSATAKGENNKVKNRMLDRLDHRRPRDLRGQPIS